jgi:TetR/AcrR family transcriptional regulator of autoinduction and epiphytic fitness
MAEEVFLEKGFHAATMDNIARRAGMSKKTIYQMFPAKTVLFETLLAERLAPLFVPIKDDDRPPHIALTEYFAAVARIVLSPRQVALTRLTVADARVPGIGAALERQGIGRGNGSLDNWLIRQQRRGIISVDDVSEAGAMLFGMTLGEMLIGQLVNTRPPLSEARIHARIDAGVAAFLRAFGRGDAGEREHKPCTPHSVSIP